MVPDSLVVLEGWVSDTLVVVAVAEDVMGSRARVSRTPNSSTPAQIKPQGALR